VFLYLLSFTIAHYRGLSLTIAIAAQRSAAQRSAAQRSEAQRSAAVVEMPFYSSTLQDISSQGKEHDRLKKVLQLIWDQLDSVNKAILSFTKRLPAWVKNRVKISNMLRDKLVKDVEH